MKGKDHAWQPLPSLVCNAAATGRLAPPAVAVQHPHPTCIAAASSRLLPGVSSAKLIRAMFTNQEAAAAWRTWSKLASVILPGVSGS